MAKNKKKKVRRSIGSGSFIRRFITAAVAICIIMPVMFFLMDDIFLSAESFILKNSAEQIAELDFTDENYKVTLSEIEASHDFYIEIYTPKDELFYTTASNQIIFTPTPEESEVILRPRIMTFLSSTVFEDGSFIELRQEYYTTAKYIVYGAFFGENSAVEIYSNVDRLKENAMLASYIILAVTIGIAIFICIIAEYYISAFTKPMIILNTTTKRLTRMDFSARAPHFKIKEIDELSGNINSLSDSLSKALKTLKSENIRLEMDIETERRTEKIMRSFIANASHELKTPISVIQAYAEGMKYGIGCDSTEQFCDIIIDETQKMNKLVIRLMEYLHYGSETYKPNSSTFNIRELITQDLEMQKKKIESVNANLTVNIDEKFYGYGDTELVLQVFNNYLSNALSHIDFERELRITAEDEGEHYTVRVFNSGKPIPGSDIENIWQSFYRADKSHSREEGRFGLGLSIVSVIQKLHEQDYGVINFEKGVEFWFNIQKATNSKN